MPKISVIVPIYNIEEYVEECINSILNQTFKDFELLLVDDGSTDNSFDICRKYEKEDNRIKVIHKKNGGLSDARNVGIDKACGEYLCFIDGDDFIANDTLENMYNLIKKNNSQIAICNMIRYYGDEDIDIFYKPSEKEIVLKSEDRFKTLEQPSVCNKMFKSELFYGVRFPYGKYYEDTFIYHELVMKASSVVLTGEDSYYYRCRRGSILDGGYTKKYFDFMEAVYLRATFLDENNIHEYADEAYLHVYSSLSNAYHNLDSSSEELSLLFAIANNRYNKVFNRLIKDKHFNIKQKIRFILLRYSPRLHCKIY
ncbi:glycosyltransferase family 2 protein [Intestinibacter bartlettii]|uniref:glycosyltransferase family 2 protein n=1 Tax=Intestinibacter bartlettii TaxID=261299 RepID=UPI0006BEDDC7|nr:glycosyltransferase family 2 protein [Intestinibacter bartlettii]CUP39536.1 glycosyl transferase [Intestinibacter bartlettii]